MNATRLPLAVLIAAASLAGWGASANAESRLEKSLKLAPGGRFRLQTDLGSVAVTGRSSSGVRIVVTSRKELDDILTLHFDEGQNSVTVTARQKHHVWFDSGSRVHWEIEVPAETALEVHTSGGAIATSAIRSTVKLDTSGGGIEVRDQTGEVQANTSGGPIRLEDIRGRMNVETSGGGITGNRLDGNLKAETSGGSIHLDRVAGDIQASSSGGGISIREAGGRVEAETSGGSIDTSFAKGNSHGGSLETSGGGIEVALDPAAGLEIEAEGNSVKTDLPMRVVGTISRGRLRGSLGNGGALLRLHTSGGGVRIHGI